MEKGFAGNINLEEGAVLLFDKPLYWTSFNLVNKVKSVLKRALGVKKVKVGHAGTLDPLATGLLIVCVGRATKMVNTLQSHSKVYVAKIRLGATTPSFDLETPIDAEYPIDHITQKMIEEKLKGFVGIKMQVPPIYSAKFVNGKRAYELARKGVEMELSAVPIEIERISVIHYIEPYLTIEVQCSKGTYIRSLARDIGAALNTGGHLVELRRTASGPYGVEGALSIEGFSEHFLQAITKTVET